MRHVIGAGLLSAVVMMGGCAKEEPQQAADTLREPALQGQYVICLDETMGANAAAPWGWGRILDVTDEKYPLQISTIALEASQARFAAQTNPDKAYYGAHYLGADDPANTSLMFFSWLHDRGADR